MGVMFSLLEWWNPRTLDDLPGSKRAFTMDEEEIRDAKLSLVASLRHSDAKIIL